MSSAGWCICLSCCWNYSRLLTILNSLATRIMNDLWVWILLYYLILILSWICSFLHSVSSPLHPHRFLSRPAYFSCTSITLNFFVFTASLFALARVQTVLFFMPIFSIILATVLFRFRANCSFSLKFQTPFSFLSPICFTFILISVITPSFSFDVSLSDFVFAVRHARAWAYRLFLFKLFQAN